MEDDNSMSDRILRILDTTINSHPEAEQFTIIPISENSQNKSPVLYEQLNIGLESWCVKHIYRYAYLELFEMRTQLRNLRLSQEKKSNINRLLNGVLLINPDVSTFWNMKRELIENDVIGIPHELNFTKLVLSYKPKSNEAFGYRRWLLKRYFQKSRSGNCDILLNELEITEMTSSKCENNYHSWTHRIWCVDYYFNNAANIQATILSELRFSENWVGQHVSEHAGFHYRQYLLKSIRRVNFILDYYYDEILLKLFNMYQENDPGDFLIFLLGKPQNKDVELVTNVVNYFSLLLYDLYFVVDSLNSIFPNHEAIWYHRRFLVFYLIKTSHEYHGFDWTGSSFDSLTSCDESKPKLFKFSQSSKVDNCFLYRNLVKSESEFIKRNMTQNEHAKKYEKWLKYVIGFKEI